MLPSRLTTRDIVRIGDDFTPWACFAKERHPAELFISSRDFYADALQLVQEGWCAVVTTESDYLFVHVPQDKHLTLLRLKLGSEFVYSHTLVGTVPVWVYHSYLDHLIANDLVAAPDKYPENPRSPFKWGNK